MTSRLLRAALAASLTAALPLSVANAVSTPVPAASPAAGATAAQTARLSNLKTKGASEIDRRLTNLNAALTRLSSSTKLTAADKTALTNQIKAEISGLTTLKAKLAADTDLATARTDVAGVVSDYRVYVLILPKTRLVTAAEQFSNVEAKFTTLEPKLQSRIDAAKTSGKDVTAMQASLTEMKNQLADAQEKSTSVIAPLLALQPADYNANHAALTVYRRTLTTANDDVKAARADAQSILTTLKGKP